MAQGGDVAADIAVAASCADVGGMALRCAGGLCDLGHVVMAVGKGLVGGIGVAAASTGVGGIALFGAGRRRHRCLEVVAQGGLLLVDVAVAAAGAGVGGVALGGAGRLGHHGIIVVAQGRDLIAHVAVAAAGAGVGGMALGRAGGTGRHGPVAVAQGRDLVAHVPVAALGAGVGGIAGFRAGRGRHNGLIGVLAGRCAGLAGLDGDGEVSSDPGDAVAVFVGGRFQALVGALGQGGDAVEAVALGELDREMYLAVAGAVLQAGFGVAGMRGSGVVRMGAVGLLGVIDGDGRALVADDAHIDALFAADGAFAAGITVGDLRGIVVPVAVAADGTGVGGIALGGAGRRGHVRLILVGAGAGIDDGGFDRDGDVAADQRQAVAVREQL